MGIDLGTNSIGWALVERDEAHTTLLDKGVCIFQEGVAREKNVEKPAVQERTASRASRRHYFRKRLRKIEVLKVLINNGFCPYLPIDALLQWKEKKLFPLDDDFLAWLRTDDNAGDNPYTDRHRALNEKLDFTKQADRYSFGRAMYHISQRRGFLSNRKDSISDSESGKVKTAISDLSQQMEIAGFQYLGDYFYSLYQTKSKIRTHYTARNEHYRKEFDRICEVQNVSEELKSSLEKAIFFQRPLKSQKGLVGKCTFEKNKPRCPQSHPRYEEFRMWQFINSIKIKGPSDDTLRPLSQEEVDTVLPLFFRKSKSQFDFEDIEKKLAGKNNYCHIDDPRGLAYKFNYREKNTVSGCPVLTGIITFLGTDYCSWENSLAECYLKSTDKTIDQIINDVWHALFSFTDDEILIAWLEENLQSEKEAATNLVTKVSIPSGYASLSLKAISKILPFLKKGYRYDQAVLMAGVSNAFSADKRDEEIIGKAQESVCVVLEDIDGGIIKVDPNKGKYSVIQEMLRNDYCAEHPERIYHPSMIETFPAVQPGKDGKFKLGSPRVESIKNPMAMRALFRLRALINELLVNGEINPATKINIEFARGLNTANMRKAIEAYQRKQNDLHKKFASLISEEYKSATGQDIQPTEEDILKYQLWEEQNHICLYTGNEIGIADFIGTNTRYDIEHTVPRSRGGDNSAMNKTLCQNKYNREIKRAKLPSELSDHEAILARIDALDWKKKIDNLQYQVDCRRKDSRAASTKDAKDNAIQRMHELKMELDYWRGKYSRFTMTEVPAGFSNRQGVDIGIIGRYARLYLQTVFPKIYVVKGSTTADFRKAWGLQDIYEKKSRESHSHHCIDAVTIACIGKSEYDSWKRYAEQAEFYAYGEAKKPTFAKPWDTFTEDVKALSEELLVSHHLPDNMGKQSRKRIRVRGKLQYSKEGKPLYVTGDTARGSLNKATYYGAIEREGEIKYVVRKKLDTLSEKDVNNIVDDTVREIVQQAIREKGFKKAMAETIWMNEKKRIPINKVRVFTPTVTNPLDLKQQRFLSAKPYKSTVYVTNESNYCMAIYGAGTKKPSFKLFNNLEAARLINGGKSDFVQLSDDNDLPLSYVLKQGMMVLFYEEKASELMFCTDGELSKRLYKVIGISSMTIQKKYSYGTITLKHHLEARQNSELETKKGMWSKGEEYRPIIGLQHNQLKCLVEGYDFKISVDGKIEYLHKI